MKKKSAKPKYRFILADTAAPFFFPGLGIHIGFGLGDQVKGERQFELCRRIEGGQKLNTFDMAFLTMIPMPADQLIFVAVRLLFDAVIDNQDAVRIFNLPQQRLGLVPEVSAGFGREGQKAGHLVVTISPSSSRSKPVAVVGPNELIK